jgi:hypothetical protein
MRRTAPIKGWCPLARSTALVALAIAVVGPVFAQASDVDWNYFGGAVIDGKGIYTFYDNNSVVRRPDGHIEVWTKGLAVSDIKRVNSRPDKALAQRVARKMVDKYVLPYASVTEIDQDQYISILSAEDIADNAIIQPRARILMELDCAGRMYRTLSLYVVHDGRQGFSDTPGDWGHVGPETNVAALEKILCQRQ